ncbi:MAG: hypothetical protein HQL48_01080, partial [Gammaproteobacteria bacterium]|nr:hypothetical protein [Gammaproteobacteria bacterium]
MKLRHFLLAPLAATALWSASAAVAADRVVIQNKGSDTLANVAQAWAENYRTINPELAVA